MKTYTPFLKFAPRFLIILFLIFVTNRSVSSQSWYDAGWLYRSQVAIPNGGASGLTDFQVEINLNVGNFDFTKSLGDGSDLRVTASDGTTLIPFWIETWTTSNASIWIKVPNIPVGGTTVFLYFGNATPTLPPAGAPVETPPVGPFTRAASNPIEPQGDPALGNYLLAENIIYDEESGLYWLVFANYRNISVGLAWSDTPTDPDSWHVLTDGENVSQVIPLANAPHLIEYGGTYYIFFADRVGFPENTGPYSISYATASSIEGPYTRFGPVLDPTPDSWETHRVDEPFVFQHNSTWYMVYMADSGDDVEQIGYATAPSITGPYTKYAGNPVLSFGDSFDHGTIADPWIYNYHGVFYIGYTVSGNGQWPWKTALATTSDWINFEKHGVIFPLAESGWDATNSFRGALMRIGNTYVFSYTGGSYQMGIATQPVYMSPTVTINDPDAVFDFYDGFDGISLNTSKWTVMNGDMENAVLNGGVLSLESGAFKTRIFGSTSFGPNTIFEGRAQHTDQGNAGRIMQLGFVDYEFLYPTRILDDDNDLTHWLRHANYPGAYQTPTAMSNPPNADTDWHIFRIYRNSTGPVDTAGFKIDDFATETQYEGVPVRNLPPYIDSYGAENEVNVDWVRVRKWAGSDLIASVGPAIANGQNLIRWTGATSTDWNIATNWEPQTVPGSSDYIEIPASINNPVCANLTIGSAGGLTIEADGALLINGNLVNDGIIKIQSTGLTSSGSLIVSGSSSGTGAVTYYRQMRTEGNDGDYHYFSSPVTANVDINSGKITTVYRYNEVSNSWSQLSMTSLLSGIGYNLDQTTSSDGLISFTGSPVNSDIVINATSPYNDVIIGNELDYSGRTFVQGDGHSGITRDIDLNYGGGGWNMLGNPYTSALLVSDFISTNLASFDPNYVAVYLYDGASAGHTRYYYIGNSTGWGEGFPGGQTHIQAGQGFFVLAMNDYSTFTFNKAMQDQSTSSVMLKSKEPAARWPGLQLKVASGSDENLTTILFNEEMTTGLDPGYDVGLMSYGRGAGIYTALVTDNGVNFTRQALPVTGYKKNVIPVGIDFESGGQVTFSAEIEPLRNYRFFLEDRLTGIFTDLTTKNYKVILPSKTYGTGRFFIHVSPARSIRPRDMEDNLLSVRIWATQEKQINIQGEVSDNAVCQVYDLNGRKLFETRLAGSDFNSFRLPGSYKGVYMVQIIDGLRKVSQRIIFL